MKKYFIILLLALVVFSYRVEAQILDDEPIPDKTEKANDLSSYDYDETEVLFNKMFEEYSPSERDVTKTDSFDDIITRASNEVKKNENTNIEPTNIYPPLNGDMYIGIKDGSFKIYQDIIGKTNCTFTVVLNSNLDRDIKRMGLSLAYPVQSFAFIFRDVPAKGSQTRYITTTGDICYNISGVPDIRINMCKIRQASGKECMNRLKWAEDIVPQ